NALLARASARGDISIVGPMLALSPVFTLLPDALLSGTLPSALGWLGLGLTLIGTVSLSGGSSWPERLRTLLARRDALAAIAAAASVPRYSARRARPVSFSRADRPGSGRRDGRASVEMAGDQAAALLTEGRLFGGAVGHGERTPRVETAAAGRIERARHLAGENDLVTPLVQMHGKRRGEERLRVGMLRGHSHRFRV